MFFRNSLLILGLLFVLSAAALGYLLLAGQDAPTEANLPEAPAATIAVLSAAHAIPSGTLLQSDDLLWKDISAPEIRPGNLVRGQISETDYLGASTQRDFAGGEALVAGDLLKASDRRFLAAVLRPGNRAISIAVDAAQSASGLILPGNHVDVILTQTFADMGLEGRMALEGRKKIVAETILQDVRVIAVDQALHQQAKTPVGSQYSGEARLPKTVTLELTRRQAEMVFVAQQLGHLQLSVRPLETASALTPEPGQGLPTWGADVSPALRHMPGPPPAPNSLESSIRRAPAS